MSAASFHDDVPQNTAFSWKLEGGDQSVFDTAPVKVRLHLVNQRLIPNSDCCGHLIPQHSKQTPEES